MNIRSVFAATLCAAAFLAPEFSIAEDNGGDTENVSYPYVEGELTFELSDDLVFSSTDPANELNDFYLNGELAMMVALTSYFSINAGLTFEPVKNPRPSTDRFFGDQGLYVEVLNAQVDIGNASIVAGKFGPGFGTAWDNTPGVYGVDFAEDYELAEMIGFGGSYAFQNMYAGTIVVGANIFFADTTFLSDSLFTRRGPTRRSDGGAANTERFDNFSVSVDGSEIPGLQGFSWHLAYRHLSPGIGNVRAENGYVAGLAREMDLGNGVTLGLTGEVAYLANAGASADDSLYLTSGMSLGHGPWHAELAGTLRRMDMSAGGAVNDYLVQASGGYEFDNGIDLSLGYAHTSEGGARGHKIGFRLTKSFEFSTKN